MAERRTLAEGLNTIEPGDRTVEKEFVYGKKPEGSTPSAPALPAPTSNVASEPPIAEPPARAPVEARPTPMLGLGRVPVGARIRTELAAALKRSSLERQLQGIEPNSIQDILEEALEPWLRQRGYLE
ncbi:hypothetical protein [Fimbriiglobus ruber]|uniref:hypothetical protein n=1 Tax=Fimbriiglobus ruber TaxID=1908690 RepID=UPI00137A58D7|nr:hypothetical protein [Fimbriiglobus ruber]